MQGASTTLFQASFEPSYAEIARVNYPPDARPK